MERAQNFARSLAVSLPTQRLDPLDAARGAIVLGCALALILAGPVLPF